MTSVGWYLGRAIPWMALLGCCAGAVAVAALLEHWPGSALLMLPALLACCTAAAAFVFDETSLAVVEVTPRGATWRRTARLAVVLVPLLVWGTAVQLRPGDLDLARSAYWFLGGAAVALAAGLAAMASRHAVPTPGAALAAGIALATLGPVIVTLFLDLDPIYPFGDFPTGVALLWTGVAAVGVACCAVGLRPAVRR